jgi:hypothetical protein
MTPEKRTERRQKMIEHLETALAITDETRDAAMGSSRDRARPG